MDLSTGSNVIPLIVAVVAAVITFGAMALLLRQQPPELLEEAAGLKLLRGYKWRELAQLLLLALRRRNYEHAGSERMPGDGGFDLLVQRGSDRFLVQCKQGARFVGAADVRNLLALMPSHDASGAILVTTGRFDPGALQAAKGHPVQLLDGFSLWREVKAILPAETLEQVGHAIGARQRLLTTVKGACAALVAAVTYVATTVAMRPPVPKVAVQAPPAAVTAKVQTAPPPASTGPAVASTPAPPVRPAAQTSTPSPTPSAAPSAPAAPALAPGTASGTTPGAPTPAASPAAALAPPPAATATLASPPAAAPAPATPKATGALPELTPAQELERRKEVLVAVRAVAGVESTDWSTKSTLAVALRAGDEQRFKELVAAVCAAVVSFEELRYTRLQVTDSLGASEADRRVHWRQCQ